MLRPVLVGLVLIVSFSLTSSWILPRARGRSLRGRHWRVPYSLHDEPKDSIKPEITSLHIRSNISYRFATTHVTSKLVNINDRDSEAVFRMRLPKTAFMTNFSMEIEGEDYDGQVKEKASALRQYQKAKSQGDSGAHVAATSRDSNDFTVSVNVAAQKKVTFTLIYQEVLQRRLSHYEHVINIDPGQIVDDLEVKVIIDESRPITFLNVPEIKKDYENDVPDDKAMPGVVIKKSRENVASVIYRPTRQQQQDVSKTGLAGQFVVQYDVKRSLDAGEIQVLNGYFVHTFAPSGLPSLAKNVLFILDLSGSMWGRKLAQLKDAMRTILDDLRHDDHFNIITFDSSVTLWKHDRLLPVTDRTIREAKSFTRRMRAVGATNINEALKRGINFLEQQERKAGSEKPSIIIFLTDGQPTVGETNTDRIQTNTRRLNEDRYAIFSIGFGNGVDFNFLKKLSLQNNALARKVYEASDATLQLKNFYKEVSIPLLYDVNITYVSDKGIVRDVTKSSFFNFFSGSELKVAGRVRDAVTLEQTTCSIRQCVHAKSALGKLILCPPGPWPPVPRPTRKPAGPQETGRAAIMERMWAYMTIQQLLDEKIAEINETKKASLHERALALSLQYHFVTPLTSMVVTKPENPDKDLGNLRDSADGKSHGHARMYQPPSPPRGIIGHARMYQAPSPPRGYTASSIPRGLRRRMRPRQRHRSRGRPYPVSAPIHRLPPPFRKHRNPSAGTNYRAAIYHSAVLNTRPASVGTGQPRHSSLDQESLKKTVRPTTYQPPPTMASVTVADPTMTLALPSGGEHVCLSWPHMTKSSHTLFEDRGYKVIVGHDVRGHVVSVSVAGPSLQESALVSPDDSGLLLGTQFRSWGKNISTSNVALRENELTFGLLPGVKFRVLRINQSHLAVIFSDVTGLSNSATGLFKSVKYWSLSDKTLRTGKGRFSTSRSRVGDVTCHATSYDIFPLTGTERRA